MTHLHVHTKYSLLDATIKIEDIANKLKDMGQTAIAITDHGNLYAAVEAYKTLSEQGIKVINGCEVYICDDVTVKEKGSKYYHLILLCKNENGRRNLNQLVSESTKYKYFGKPRIDFEMLKAHHEGLICMSACMAGEVSRAISAGDMQLAEQIALKYKDLFGDDYYIEYQAHENEEQQKLNAALIRLAEKFDIKYAVTCDAHYLNKEDQKYHSIFVKIGSTREVGETYDDCYLQSEEEVLQKCYLTTRYNLKAIETTDEIAAKCENTIPLSAPIIPHVSIPDKYKTELEYLKYLCNQGFISKGFASWNIAQWRKYMTETVIIDGKTITREIIHFDTVQEIRAKYLDRARYEMNAIEKMGFEGYYLLVHSYVSCVKRRGIARGSGGGSLVAYLSGIVDIDPIKYGLYFERFIDVGALALLENGSITKKDLKIPDVDTDFAPSERAAAIDFVVNKYGRENVVALGQFGYIKAKGAIKDIGRVLGIPFEITNQMTKNLDGEISIGEALDLGLLNDYKNKYPELFEYASKLAGLPKSFGVHPCFTGDTLVLTRNGTKRIDAVEVGDEVLTHKGNYKLVVKTMCRTTDVIHRISVCGIRDITCTPNHPFYVRRRTSITPKEYSSPQWIEAKDVAKYDMLCVPIDHERVIPKYNDLFEYKACTKDCMFYDEVNNCIWVNVKNNIAQIVESTNVYNLSVVDDNTYTANGIAVHNCGKVISMAPASEYNAIEYNEKTNEWVLQGDMHTADDLGLVKCDFLGLRTLDVIYDVLDMIGKDYNYIAPHRIDTSDPVVWNEFAEGHTDCIFQFESPGMKRMLADMKCDNIENLSAANALYRPGSKDYIPNYVNRKNGTEEITYLHPDLEPVLSNSYGIIVFQEQLIEIGRLAGLANPDELRKATAKKKPKLMAKIEPELKNGLKNRGWTQQQVDELWETILQFAKYSFNKCVSGDTTLIKLGQKKSARNPTVEQMYNIMHSEQYAKDNNFVPLRRKYLKNGYPSALSMFEDGRIHKNKIVDIRKSGVREIFRVITADGYYVDCTMNHKFPTPDGEKTLEKLNVGDTLYVIEGYKFTDSLPVVTKTIKSIEYLKTDETYDITMSDPAHNFVANNGLVVCNSHSSAYALTAYISMYLKVHHTAEFVTACINSYEGDITNIVKTIEEGKRMNVDFRFRDWRFINSRTECEDGIVYLGINTIKDFGNSVAEALHRISEKSKTYIDFLKAADDESDLSDKQIDKLIVHGFLKEFGDAGILLKIHDIFIKVYGRKQFNKDTNLPVDADILRKFSKETEKQFRNIRSEELFEYLCGNITPAKIPITMILNAELEDYGYISYRNEKARDFYYVTSIDTKYSPKLKLYDLCSGETFDCKVSKKMFNKDPICLGSIIKAIIEEKPKVRKTETGWENIPGQFDKWLKTYIIKR